MISQDQYKYDLRPNQSVTPFFESFSSISWSPIGNRIFATTAWCGQLRAFEIVQTELVQKLVYKFPSPALKCCWNQTGTLIFVGLMDGTVKCYDISSGQIAEIGKHTSAISSLHFLNGQNAVVSSGYESNIYVWKLGMPNPAISIHAQSKVLASDVVFPVMVAATSEEKILVADLTNPGGRVLLESNDLGKGSQLQSIALNPKGSSLGLGSYDGRANISILNKNINSQQTLKSVITFKSNKQEQNNTTVLYPINSVSFNPTTERWFMTAGSDGVIHFWDYQAKNKIKSLSYNGIPVCAAKVNHSGDMVAYALGNDWHLGAEGMGKWEIKLGVHIIIDAEKKYHK